VARFGGEVVADLPAGVLTDGAPPGHVPIDPAPAPQPLDLDAVPRPAAVPMQAWLTCFPAYSFLLCCPPGRADEVLAAFHSRDLEAAVAGTVDGSGLLALRSGGRQATVLDLRVTGVTGLAR
jgi:selenophosphate synthetase-related protein